MRTVFLDYDTVSNGDLDTSPISRIVGEVRFYPLTADAQIAERIADAEVVLANKVKLPRAHLEAARALKLIALAATGTDNIDLAAAQALGIAVCNVRGYCTAAVVQHAWAMILSLNQHLPAYARLAADGTWVKSEEYAVLAYPIRELAGLTLGIIGWGTLGRGVAKVGEAFGMRVIVGERAGVARESHAAPESRAAPGFGAPPYPERVPLEQLLRTADIVSLHCPSTAATRGMIGAAQLALMKPDAILINTARGALVDSAALAEALRERRLAGAGIDVLPQEPPVDGDPLLDPDLPNLIVTPHIAWAARAARQRCLDEMAANIEDFLRGGRRGRVV
jgi:glycerate dehydrogenase